MQRSRKRHIISLTPRLTAILAILTLVVFSSPPASYGQADPSYYQYPYNHLKWYTLESKHFMIHFQKGNSRSAQVVSRVAEEVYPKITTLYHHEPNEKVSIVLKDREDYSNGATYFFDNMIDIWVPPLDTPLRGTHNWFRNVISHEFTHMVQIQAAMKHSRQIPAVYLQWLSYEDVRRPDVLYGYPKGIVTFPFADVNVPAWFAEGTAQFQREGMTYDTWDSHRDMIMRTNILDHNYLGFTEMTTFSSKTSLERETVYNQGFAFTKYIAHRFGEDVLAKITDALSQTGVHKINRAIEMATGIPGKKVFDDWIQNRTQFYQKSTASLHPTTSNTVEELGFYNFYPTFTSDGQNIAYLSNRGRDYSRLSLYVKNIHTGKTVDLAEVMNLKSSPLIAEHTYSCGFSVDPVIDYISSAFSFSPDGKQLIFTKAEKNKYGELYRDFYLYDVDKKKIKTQLTHDQRLQDPAWSPNGHVITAIQLRDATQNLVTYDIDSDSITSLTHYKKGEQVFKPEWSPDGQSIYFAYTDSAQRAIKKFDLATGDVTTILDAPHTDFRDPTVGPNGQYLYYSANPDGIFNIYRIPVDGGKRRQLTSVLGGAFMPTVNKDGVLAYADYRSGGYKIATVSLTDLLQREHFGTYTQKDTVSNASEKYILKYRDLNNFNDHDIDEMPNHYYAVADTGKFKFNLSTTGAPNQRSFYSYDQTITDFSFFPVLRFDNYSKLNGSNYNLLKAGHFGDLSENLVRDMKAGFYFSSREVTSRLSIFGGALFGLGSRKTEGINDFFKPARLVDLDRDLFFSMEYQGLPFIKRYWSPTISVELYNLRRNVKNGLSIEEFPCTSCLPDTTSSDIAYGIWEADVYLRSKLGRGSLLELGIGYSPYRVSTEGFTSRELDQYVPGSTSQYFKGTTYSTAYDFDWDLPYRNSDIAPIGLKGYLKYAYQKSKLLDDYKIDNGILSPVYQSSKNHSFELNARYGFHLWGKQTGQVHSRFFSYLNNPGDYFYLDYIGGLTGMRSYPFFALGGNTTAFSELSYNVPLLTGINTQVNRYTLDKLYARFFVEAGNGWHGPLDIGNSIKTGAGAELRFAFNSYYLFPLKLFISGSYGFNQFDVKLPSEFITTGSESNRVQYGREFLIHFGLTFDFELL